MQQADRKRARPLEPVWPKVELMSAVSTMCYQRRSASQLNLARICFSELESQNSTAAGNQLDIALTARIKAWNGVIGMAKG